MSLPKFDYRAPKSVEEAVGLMAEYGDDALVIAGGLTVVILLRERLARPGVLISLSDIAPFSAITINDHGSLGAMVTHSQVTKSPDLAGFAPLLTTACSRVGSPGIRNMGTVCGSVSHGDGASDTAPALLALDAEAMISGPDGERIVPLDKFFFGVFETALNDGELLTALRIPRASESLRTRFKKFTCTSAEAYAAVTVAAALDVDVNGICRQARIGLGSVAPKPMRATEAEMLLNGQKLTSELIAEAADVAAGETDPPSDGQGTSQYRRDMTRVWVRRLLDDIMVDPLSTTNRKQGAR